MSRLGSTHLDPSIVVATYGMHKQTKSALILFSIIFGIDYLVLPNLFALGLLSSACFLERDIRTAELLSSKHERK